MRRDLWVFRAQGSLVDALRSRGRNTEDDTPTRPNFPLEVQLVAELHDHEDDAPPRLNVSSPAYESAHVVHSGAGVLYGFTVYSSNVAAQFIHIFDLTTIPANGAVPAVVFSVSATANRGVEWVHGRPFYSGCVIANSTTGPTLTAGAADCFFDVQYSYV